MEYLDDLGEGKLFVVIRDGFRKEREAVADASKELDETGGLGPEEQGMS